jgi:hypothetical protein
MLGPGPAPMTSVAVPPALAAWRVDDWLGDPGNRPTLLEIGEHLGLRPTPCEGIIALREPLVRAIYGGSLCVFRARATLSGGGGQVPAPPPRRAPAPPTPTVNPVINPAKLVVVVAKTAKDPRSGKVEPYTHPKRRAVRLSTDGAFDGTGTFTCDQSARVKLWSAATGGVEIKLDGHDNVFKPGAPPAWTGGATLAGGVTVHVEGRRPSGAMDDITFKLALSGGSRRNGPDDHSTVTAVEVTLDICAQRPSPGAEPPPLSPDDKVFVGRNLVVQDAAHRFERAQLIIRKVEPATFAGELVLTAKNAGVTAFREEHPKGGERGILPYTIATGKVAGPGGKLWAQGASPSGDMRDTGFVLGIKGLEDEGDRVTATAVQLVLDLCQSRTARDVDPAALSANDKVAVGRFLHEQDEGWHHGRALLLVGKVVPDTFDGKLVLDVVGAGPATELHEHELHAGADPRVAVPLEIDYAKEKNEDKRFWVEGKKASAALRDAGYSLRLKGDEPTSADAVRLTVVKFSDLQADIPSTPANQAVPGPSKSPVPRHLLVLAPGGSPRFSDFDHDYAVNEPLVLIEGSVRATDPIKLSVAVEPAAAKAFVRWSVARDRRTEAPRGDHPGILALPGNSDDPGLVQDQANKLRATLTANAVGSFHVQPFIDNNGNDRYELDDAAGQRIDREPYLCMNLVLVRVQGISNDCWTNDEPGGRDIISYARHYFQDDATVLVPDLVRAGDTVHYGMNMDVTAWVVGGGEAGLRGLDQVFSGWVNNELNSETSPGPGGLGEDATHTFQKRAPAPNPPARTRNYWKVDGKEISGPVLDSGYGREAGTGGYTCTGTQGINGCQVDKSDDPSGIGACWRVTNGDSPNQQVFSEHPADRKLMPAERRTLRNFRFNLDWRCALLFWTNRAKVEGNVDQPACRLYSTVSTNTWSVRCESTFDDSFTETRVVRKTIAVVKDGDPTRLAMPVDGSGIETRGPMGKSVLIKDEPF